MAGGRLKKDTRARAHTHTHILQVSCGGEHAALITAAGTILAWGSNALWQLGSRRGGSPHEELGIHDEEDALDAADLGAYAYEPIRMLSHHAAAFMHIACGRAHTVALARDDAVFVWGCNAHGQCGVDIKSEGDEHAQGAAAQVLS